MDDDIPLSSLKDKILGLFRKKSANKHPPTNGLPPKYPTLLDHVALLADEQVEAAMVPRNQMITIESESSLKEAVDLIIREGFSRIPVQEKKKDNICGILYSKDILCHIDSMDAKKVKNVMRKPLFVRHEQKVSDVLEFFRKNKTHMAVVLDEYGGVDGIITMEDVMETLVGEIEDEFDRPENSILEATADGAIVEGECELEKFNDHFHTALWNEDTETLSGYITNKMNKIPDAGEILETKNCRFEILESDARRILKVKYSSIDEIQDAA